MESDWGREREVGDVESVEKEWERKGYESANRNRVYRQSGQLISSINQVVSSLNASSEFES